VTRTISCSSSDRPLSRSTRKGELVKRLGRVLCAVDIGEPGRAAFAHALALARAHGATMHIVHAVPSRQGFETEATERVAYLLELRALAEAAGVEVRVDVRDGDGAEIILQHAGARRADLIVLSSAHGTGANGPRISSVVDQVLRVTACPTLVVRSDRNSVPERALRNVVYAVNFSPSSNAAIDRALSLAAGRERRLTLLHVVPGPEEDSTFQTMGTHDSGYYHHLAASALQRLQGLIPASAEATVLARVTVGNVASEIVRVARASEADVVVMGTQARSRLGYRVPIIRQVLQEAPCPVLAVPAPKAIVTEHERRPAA
jgi:nucleotide-binding universal stress UspA family protein